MRAAGGITRQEVLYRRRLISIVCFEHAVSSAHIKEKEEENYG